MRGSFIGHRDSIGMENKVYASIATLFDRGVREFYSGGMGNFDKMCERVVKKLGGRVVFVPYNVRQIKPEDELWYDEIICPFGTKEYCKNDIPDRNKWIVDNCDIFLCYVRRRGGAKYTMEYAIRNNKKIMCI